MAPRSNATMAGAQTLPQASYIYDWLQATTTPLCQKDQSRQSVRPNFRSSKGHWLHCSNLFHSSDDKLRQCLDGVDHGEKLITTCPNECYVERDEDEYNPYAKRPRRRTRADRYIPDDDQLDGTNSKKRKRLPKKSSKRKRQESSGTLLLHRYNTDNVLSSRLTVSFTLMMNWLQALRSTLHLTRICCLVVL